MGWGVEVIIDFFVVGAMNEAGKRLPPWGFAALLVLPLALVIGLLRVFVG
jgi:hypothetical protein